MAFALTGTIDGMEYHMLWDGKSYAPESLLDLYRAFLRTKQGQFVGFPPGAGTDQNHDSNAPAAYAAWMNVFDTIIERTGDFPWEAHEAGEVF